jgi:hypothetical protein
MIEDKIKKIGEEIVKEEEKIVDFQVSINEKRKEIEELEVLRKRLWNIHRLRLKENVGDPEKVNDLVNQYRLTDLLSIVAKLADTNLSYSADMMPLMNLTIWQGLYLFFGDNVSYQKPAPDKTELDVPEKKE